MKQPFLTIIISDTNYLSFVGCNYTRAGQITSTALTANQRPKFKNHYILTRIIMKENSDKIELIKEQYKPTGHTKAV